MSRRNLRAAMMISYAMIKTGSFRPNRSHKYIYTDRDSCILLLFFFFSGNGNQANFFSRMLLHEYVYFSIILDEAFGI